VLSDLAHGLVEVYHYPGLMFGETQMQKLAKLAYDSLLSESIHSRKILIWSVFIYIQYIYLYLPSALDCITPLPLAR
jgi:hypothetical protein